MIRLSAMQYAMRFTMRPGVAFGVAVAGALVCWTSMGPAYAAFPTGNLLVNPGAETGDLTGWTAGGDSNPGVDNGSFDSGINPHTGVFDFYGGSGLQGKLSQNVSLIAAGVTAAEIDSNTLLASISFWEQGLNQGTPSDNARVVLSFLDQSNALIGGSILADTIDSHTGNWQQFTGDFLIPVDTRSITYTVVFDRHAGSDLDAFVDDNSLSITSGAVTVPEGSTATLVGLALPMIGAVAIARRYKK